MAQRTGGSAAAYTEYDWASEHVADSSPTPDTAAMEAEEAENERIETACHPPPDAAAMVSASFRLIAERTGGNPFLLLAVLGRVGGLTLKEIGALSGCTKQAVDKHLREIGKKDQAMAAMLRRRWHYQAALDPSAALLAKMGLITAFNAPHGRSRRHCPSYPPQPYLPGMRG